MYVHVMPLLDCLGADDAQKDVHMSYVQAQSLHTHHVQHDWLWSAIHGPPAAAAVTH